MDLQNIKLDHPYAKTCPKKLTYLEIEHKYAKQTLLPFSRGKSINKRKCCQRLYKMQNRAQYSDLNTSQLGDTAKCDQNGNQHVTGNTESLTMSQYANCPSSIVSDHPYAKLPPTLITSFQNSEEYKNINLDKIKLEHKTKVIQKLKAVRPSSVCCICGKILYPSSEYWLEDIPLNEQRARQVVPEASHVTIAYKEKWMSNDNVKTLTSSCLECSVRHRKGKTLDLFDDFGDQPQCIKDLSSYTEYSKLAIASLNCNTFAPQDTAICTLLVMLHGGKIKIF